MSRAGVSSSRPPPPPGSHLEKMPNKLLCRRCSFALAAHSPGIWAAKIYRSALYNANKARPASFSDNGRMYTQALSRAVDYNALTTLCMLNCLEILFICSFTVGRHRCRDFRSPRSLRTQPRERSNCALFRAKFSSLIYNKQHDGDYWLIYGVKCKLR